MLLGRHVIGTVAYMGGVPSLPEPFVWCWTQMIEYNSEYLVQPNERIHYDRATISFHSMARNQLVSQMQGDWLLMLDIDMTFEPDICARLLLHLERDGADAVTGVYVFKGPLHSPVLYTSDGKSGLAPIGDWDRPQNAEAYLMPIESAGAGCLMVRRSVLDQIAADSKSGPFDIEPPYGEDHSFFRRLKKSGCKAYASPTIRCGHLAWRAWTLDDYTPNQDMLGERKMLWQQ